LIIKNYKFALIVGGLVLLLIVAIALISSIWPVQEERFFELGLLGKNETADSYFANDNSVVDLGSASSWFIYVHNHMGTPQTTIVKAKLLNSTMQMPNNQQNQPSNGISFANFPLTLSTNQTTLVPFTWSIADAKLQNGVVNITRLIVNGQDVAIDISAPANSTFNIVFELWVQNQAGQYNFSWDSGNGLRSASIYIMFDVSIPPE
jgi:hypothetical protein